MKRLKEQVKAIDTGSANLEAFLSSTEFKQAFDAKVNQVLTYIKSDVVPKALKKAADEA